MNLPFKIYNLKQYWKTKKLMQLLSFNFRRFSFISKKKLNLEKDTLFNTYSQFKIVLWQIIKAISSVIILLFIESYSTELWNNYFNVLPNWLLKIQSIIPLTIYPENKDAVLSLVSVIASVTGVILALFYPVLATIASTAYAKVHANIRNLLFYDKETQNFLKRLTFLTAFSITLLLFLSLDYKPRTLTLLFITLYSLISLFGILKIGIGVYSFFDPSTLSEIVKEKVLSFFEEVTTKGENYDDVNFQSYYHSLANEQIENISTITRLSIDVNGVNDSSFITSINTSYSIMQNYLALKAKIPKSSLWYPNIYEHSSYFTSDQINRSLVNSTNTFTQPKNIQDYFWFEDKILNNIAVNSDKLINNGHIGVFNQTLRNARNIYLYLGYNLDTRTGKSILNQMYQNIISVINNTSNDVIDYEDIKAELSSIEFYSLNILSFQIYLIDRIISFDSIKIEEELKKINWLDNKSIYKTELIVELYDTLNEISENIKNEKLVEGIIVTPDWYLKQKISAEFVNIIGKKLEETISLIDKYILSLVDDKQPLLTSFLIQKGLEIINKIFFRFEKLKRSITDISKLEQIKGEFTWTNPDFDKIDLQLKGYENKCILILSNNLVNTSKIVWNNQFPDVFGQSYAMISSYINKYFDKNKEDLISKVFPGFLKSALIAFAQLNERYKDYFRPINISYQVLDDVMEISGYAYIYSKVYKNDDYWNNTKNTWDKYFTPTENNINLLITIYEYYKTELLGVGINFQDKHTRQIKLKEIIKREKIDRDKINDCFAKIFIEDSYMPSFDNVSEVFIETYLFKLKESTKSKSIIQRKLLEKCKRMSNK